MDMGGKERANILKETVHWTQCLTFQAYDVKGDEEQDRRAADVRHGRTCDVDPAEATVSVQGPGLSETKPEVNRPQPQPLQRRTTTTTRIFIHNITSKAAFLHCRDF